VSQRIPLSNDEIEVACDLLWFVNREIGLSGVAEALWEQLQPIRHGDYGGTASSDMSTKEAHALVDVAELTHLHAARKFFNLGERYERWRDYRVDPHGVGLHGLELAPGEVVRLTQEEVEAHPAWKGFGGLAPFHPPMRGWLASAVCGEDGRSYGLLQLSDKAGGEDFTEKDADCLRELAAFAGATLDAFRAAKRAA
jgi:hypothetical protein